jgi:hypothetical protein
MAHIRTLLVDVRKLDRQGEEGAIVVSLMMACNDLTAANQALGACRDDSDEKTDYIRRGAAMYFIRLQMAHLHEALKIVKRINTHANLLSLINDCPDGTADHFAELLCFAEGGTKRCDFKKYVGSVRNKIAFHYDKEKIKSALSDRARRRGDVAHFMTVADDIRRVRFQVADDLVNTLVCHHVWEIATDADTRIVADQKADFGFKIYKIFLDFAGVFITRYVEKNATFAA